MKKYSLIHEPSSVVYRLVNLSKMWEKKFKPHLHDSLVEEALEAGMSIWCQQYIFGAPKTFYPEIGPYSYSRFLQHRRKKNPPLKDSYQWYDCQGACHWMAAFSCALGQLAYPELGWLVIRTTEHSVAVGCGPKKYYFIDITNDRDINKILEDIGWDLETEELNNGNFYTLEEEIVHHRCEFREYIKKVNQ